MKLRLVGFALLLAACGSSSGSGDDAGPAPDGGTCGAAVCSASSCGTVTDACGATVQCDLCRYDGDGVGSGGGPLELSVDNGVDVAYGDVFTKTIATRATPWTTASTSDLLGTLLGFDRAADGTPWLLYEASGNGIAIAHETAGVWASETVAMYSRVAALALASDGTPWVAFTGENPQNVDQGVVVAHRDAGGSWTDQTVAMVNSAPPFVGIALAANGPDVAWTEDQSGTLDAAIPDGHGGFTDEVVDPQLEGYADHHLEIGIDGQNRPVIAYRHDSAFDRAIGYAVRDGGTWQLGLASSYSFGDGDVRMAISPTSGEVAIAYQQDEGYQIAALDGGVWSVQTVAAEGCEGDLDVAFQGATLLVARACRGQIDLITRNGQRYPSDYAATCATVADDLCTKGATCANSGNDSCIGTGFCAGPESWCVALATSDVCGNPTLDPGVLTTCSAAAAPGALTCTTGIGEQGVVVPAACPYTF